MVLISRAALRAFARLHPEAEAALEDWYRHVLAADWADAAAVRQSFASAAYLGHERFAFALPDHPYRLIASIAFSTRTVYIRFLDTHRAYAPEAMPGA